MREFNSEQWQEVGKEAADAAAKAAAEQGTFFQFGEVGDKIAGKLVGYQKDITGNYGPETHLRMVSPELGNFTVRANKDLRERVDAGIKEGRIVVGSSIIGIVLAAKKDIGKPSPMNIYRVLTPPAAGAPAPVAPAPATQKLPW